MMMRTMKFAAACVVIAVVWLKLLPRLSDWPPIREHIDSMQQQDINPSAMFYTEVGD